MSDKANSESDVKETVTEERPLKIESVLPVKTVSIESVKEGHTDTMSPHRRIFKWFARRPTTTTRLAILGSVLPPEVEDEQLLRWMCVGPKENIETSIEEYVLNKHATKDDRDGSIEEHFGYEYTHRRLPSESEIEDIHETVRSHWDGELPLILDPTAGGGTIPLEALRYGFPTVSNELNPVAWLLNKVILEFAPTHGSLESDVRKWMSRISESVEQQLSEFFPKRNGVEPNHYFRAYSIDCPACGKPLPISNRWWFNKRLSAAVRPYLDEEENLRFEAIKVPEEVSTDEFDPDEGTVEGGDVTCPHCNVVTERTDVVEIFKEGEFDYELCGVRYTEKIDGTQYHSPTDEDREAVRKAKEKIDSDLELATLLTQDRYIGYYDRSEPYGIEQWRDLYSPRQLLSHAAYLQAFNDIKPDILKNYSEKKGEAVLTLLSFISVKMINRNSRLEPIKLNFGSPNSMLGNNNFSFQWHFGESNLMSGTFSYETEAKNILDHYEEVVQYVSHTDPESATVQRGDASDLPQSDNSVGSVVVDPPYGDSIMYAEVADAFYVWFREYLRDIYPSAFSSPETNKEDEAVENPVIVSEESGSSTADAARKRYEEKMSGIFSEAHRVLETGGCLTIYFTDKEVSAWDSLTMSIIQSGFDITATHTITTEMPQRIGVKDDAAADTTLLLTCRKPIDNRSEREPTLWRDIQEETRIAAREKANELYNSNHNLTKTDMIISAFGPTLRTFTQNYPVVDDKDNPVRPKEALREARAAVTKVIIERELSGDLEAVDPLTTWYVLSWLVYDREDIPYDEARQLGMGVGVEIDDVKYDSKIWGKSKKTLLLKGQNYRVQDYTELEAGEDYRKRAFGVNPQDTSFDYNIDAVHAALNVLDTKGSDFVWNWIQDRDLQNKPGLLKTIQSLHQVLPNSHPDKKLIVDLLSGETGELLDADVETLSKANNGGTTRTTLEDF
jgi:adenine-specific DNA methylase